MRTKTETKTEVKEEKEKFNLPECFVLWLKKGKSGVEFLDGHLQDGTKIVGFFNTERNEKQPKIKIYTTKDDGALDLEVIALWESESKAGNTYLSGETNDQEKIIAFYTSNPKEKSPFLKGYYKES